MPLETLFSGCVTGFVSEIRGITFVFAVDVYLPRAAEEHKVQLQKKPYHAIWARTEEPQNGPFQRLPDSRPSIVDGC